MFRVSSFKSFRVVLGYLYSLISLLICHSNVLIALVSTSPAHIAVCNRVVNENMINVAVESLSRDQKSKICQNKLKIRNQHKKCIPMICNMTMFGELQFGRPLADPHFHHSPGPKYKNLAK